MTIEPDEVAYLLEKELAARWRVAQATLQRWRYRGVGPDFVKLSGRILYSIAAIDAFERQSLQAMGRGAREAE